MDNEKNPQRRKTLPLLTILITAISFYFVLLRWDSVSSVIGIIGTALAPVAGGIVIAYILRPLALRLELLLRRWIKPLKNRSLPRAIAITVVMIAFLGVLTAFCFMIIPQVVQSLKGLITIAPGKIAALLRQLESYLQTNNESNDYLNRIVLSIQSFITTWIQQDMLGTATALISNAVSILSGIINVFVSVCVAIYIMIGWERYVAQMKKLFLSIGTSPTFNETVFETFASMNRIFSGYVGGKLLDCLIVGVICFLFNTVAQLPYALLISVIVGVTNVIPVFGPFIGGIISAFLLLLVSPSQCLIFIIFILILQQLDGNVIGPYVLGDSTGINALYVMVGVLLFGKLFGFLGMVIGVPLFATLYVLIKRLAEQRLAKRGLPTETRSYEAPPTLKKRERPQTLRKKTK